MMTGSVERNSSGWWPCICWSTAQGPMPTKNEVFEVKRHIAASFRARYQTQCGSNRTKYVTVEISTSCFPPQPKHKYHIFEAFGLGGGRRGTIYTTWLLNANNSPDSLRICTFTSYRPLDTLFECDRVITHLVSGCGIFLNSTDKQSVDSAYRV